MSTDTSTSQYSEPPWAKNPPGSQLPWYIPNIDKYLVPAVTDVLENYSQVPKDKLSTHVHAIRDQTYSIRSYPTTGAGCFITPYISTSPVYASILSTLKSGGNFLDIGAMLGVDMRKLVFDGAPSTTMTAVDITPDFWPVGYELYRDKDTFRARHVVGDVLTLSENTTLSDLNEEKIDVISISAVLHQFDWDTQIKAVKEVLAFSKVGTLIVGYQIGSRKCGPDVFGPAKTPVFVQDQESLGELWRQAGKEVGVELDVDVKLLAWGDLGWDAEDMKLFMKEDQGVLGFVFRRVA